MDYSDRIGSSRTSPAEGMSRAWGATKEKTEEVIDSGETCVREHPGSAILTSFAGGVAVGCFIGWFIAESREHQHRSAIRSVLHDLQKRMRL